MAKPYVTKVKLQEQINLLQDDLCDSNERMVCSVKLAHETQQQLEESIKMSTALLANECANRQDEIDLTRAETNTMRTNLERYIERTMDCLANERAEHE